MGIVCRMIDEASFEFNHPDGRMFVVEEDPDHEDLYLMYDKAIPSVRYQVKDLEEIHEIAKDPNMSKYTINPSSK